MGRGLWYENRRHNVDVMVLAPGSTDTNAPIRQGISRDQLVGIMQPGEVATLALQHLGKLPVYIPGVHNRLFMKLLGILPQKLAIMLAGYGMERAIKNSNTAG